MEKNRLIINRKTNHTWIITINVFFAMFLVLASKLQIHYNFIIALAIVDIFILLPFLDRKPICILLDTGVMIRSSSMPFARLIHVKWEDIMYYSVKVEKYRAGETKYLSFYLRSREIYRVNLYDSDADEILLYQNIENYTKSHDITQIF